MNAYRLYLLTSQENVSDIREVRCVDDAQAMAEADLLSTAAHAVEVWRDDRLVGRVGGEFRIAGRL